MKAKFYFLIAVIALMTCAVHLACSVQEEEQLAMESPRLAPATQFAERVQRTIDPIAIHTQHGAQAVQRAAEDASDLGVPGASIVALLAGAVGTIAGIYNERRRGTTPLRTALTQVVRSVDVAFPQKTAQQKAALTSTQDPTTARLVRSIKTA